MERKGIMDKQSLIMQMVNSKILQIATLQVQLAEAQKDLERKKTTYDASKTANDKAKQNEKTARCQLEMAESTYNNSKIRLT